MSIESDKINEEIIEMPPKLNRSRPAWGGSVSGVKTALEGYNYKM